MTFCSFSVFPGESHAWNSLRVVEWLTSNPEVDVNER